MAAEMTLAKTRAEFTGEALPSEPGSATERAASEALESSGETRSHQAWRRHPGVGEQAVYAGDAEIGQPSTTSGTRPEPSPAVPNELLILVAPPASRGEHDADRILRVHFVNPILTDLRQIQRHCGTPAAAMYADSILHTIRAMRDLVSYDPYVEVALALYDAMAFQNQWLNYMAEQYEGAHRVLRTLAGRSQLRNNDVENAILDLEDLGFDTTPFEMDGELANDVDDEG